MTQIPRTYLAGDDQLWRKREELKRKLQHAQSSLKDNNDERKPKKVKWGQLILGLIGMVVGTFLVAQSSSPTGALIFLLLIIIFLVIYLAVKNK